jgi:Protein of unknown function (DUF1236)
MAHGSGSARESGSGSKGSAPGAERPHRDFARVSGGTRGPAARFIVSTGQRIASVFIGIPYWEEVLAMKRLPQHIFPVAALAVVLAGTGSWNTAARAQPAAPTSPAAPASPSAPPAVAPKPRLTLSAEQEYIIREYLLKDPNVPKESSVPATIGDVVPDNVTLRSLPAEVVAKVPLAQAHKYFLEDDTVVLVSPSDRRVADVIKKKSTD